MSRATPDPVPQEEWTLVELTGGWTKFEQPPANPDRIYGDRHLFLKTASWIEMGRPTTLLVTVEQTPANEVVANYGRR